MMMKNSVKKKKKSVVRNVVFERVCVVAVETGIHSDLKHLDNQLKFSCKFIIFISAFAGDCESFHGSIRCRDGLGETSLRDVHVSADAVKVSCFPQFVDIGPIAGAIGFGQQLSKDEGVSNACLNLALVNSRVIVEAFDREHGSISC